MIQGGMEVVRKPSSTTGQKDKGGYEWQIRLKRKGVGNLLESAFMTVMAPIAPRKTVTLGLCTDMMLVMKKVLSPSSDAVISEEEAMKEFQKVFATAYGVILQLLVGLLVDWIQSEWTGERWSEVLRWMNVKKETTGTFVFL